MLLKNPSINIRSSSHSRGDGENIFRAACRANLEGIIGKKADSLYSGTRNGDWIKVKCGDEQEFVMAGIRKQKRKPAA